MTVHPFPDRKGEVASGRRAARSRRHVRNAASIAKSTLALWLIPWLFWLSLIDALDDGGEEDGDGNDGGR